MTHLRLKVYLILLFNLSQFTVSYTQFQNNWNTSTGPRIVGGDIFYEPVPYQISFQRPFRGRWRHFCSGSIISPDFVLTAAHCVNGLDVKILSVLAGVTNLKSTHGSRHSVQGYKIHEQFAPVWKCDIAIVKVSPPFQLNRHTIDAICFTDTAPVIGGTSVILTGWGSMNQTGRDPFPDHLQVLTTNVIQNSDCKKYMPKLMETEICTFRTKLRGACNGDSGGPLVSYDRTKLVGIVAFGTRKCASGFPDFFTRVSEFVEWIVGKMAEPWP